jgi:CheY-like chemotaxis protein
LGELGYTVLEAENGRAALNLIESRPDIRLLFTDVGLPGGLNGRQLAEAAKKHRPNLKVLFTTGYARNAIVHDGRLDPGVELITKPFSQAALAAKLRDILDADRAGGRILLVEDEALIQMLAEEFLQGAGFTVDSAGSAAEAMNKLRLIPGGVDAAIVDIGLPDRQGDDLVREMRAVYPLLPVVIASGRGVEDLRATFKGEQRIAFISKPYMETELLTALKDLGLNCQV